MNRPTSAVTQPDPVSEVELIQQFSRVSRWAAIAAVGLLGWVANVWGAAPAVPHWLTIRGNTALATIGSGVALDLWHRHHRLGLSPPPPVRGLIWGCCAIAIAIGAAGLLGFSAGGGVPAINLAVAPNTAGGVIALGCGVLLSVRDWNAPAQSCGLLTLSISILALVGHLYHAAPFYSAGSPNPMDAQTATALLLLSASILCARPERGWMAEVSSPYAGGIAIRRLLPVTVAIPTLLGLFMLAIAVYFPVGIETLTALRTILGILAFGAFLWWNGRSMNRIDAHRQDIQISLLNAERRYRAIFNQSFQFVGLLDLDGTLLEANQTALEFGGLTATDAIGKPFWEVPWWRGSAESREQLREAIAQAVRGEPVRYEVDVLGQNDAIATIDFSLRPILDPDGKTIFLIPEGRDISDRKRLEEQIRRDRAQLEVRIEERTRQLEISNDRLRQEIAERRQTEIALRESEELFRSTFEQAAVGIAHVGLQGSWLRVNQKLCDIVGYTRKELLQCAFGSITHPEDLPEDLERMRQLMAGQIESYSMEKRYIHKDGSPLWISLVASLRYRPTGEPHHFIAVVQDISELKRAQEELERRHRELKESEEKFRQFAEHIREIFFSFTPDYGTLLYVSPAYEELWGRSCQSLYDRPTSWLEAVHPEDRDRVGAAFERTLAGAPFEEEYRICRPDGSQIWVRVRTSFVRDAAGEVLRVVGVTEEITKRKNAELCLAAQLRQQAGIALLSQKALSGLDLCQLFDETVAEVAESLDVEYSKILQRLPGGEGLLLKAGVGWAPGLVGQAIVGADGDSQAGYTLLTREPVVVESLDSETRFSGPELLRDHGVVSGISVAIEGADDRPFGVLGIHTRRRRHFDRSDVNFLQSVANLLASAIARREAERELRQLNAHLEERVRVRTQQLQKSNQELESFSYSVSHDLRAPLRAIQGLTQALWEDYGSQLADDMAREYTHRIMAAATQMDTLIRDLLTYSRLGRAEIHLNPVALDGAIEEVWDTLDLELRDAGVQLKIAPDLPVVYGNYRIIYQAIANLLANAAKFVAPDVRPTISIWATQTDGWARLWVADNGIGIDPQYHDRIFRVFERLHGVESYPGTGIGLAIVRRGIERLGGRCGVESNLDEGSKFWIELPTSPPGEGEWNSTPDPLVSTDSQSVKS
ncbi:MAG: PAS domain S-box protein [Limnospira sp.]